MILEKIDDIIASLTPEEREFHRELIEECKERELDVIQIGKSLRENVEKITQISLRILLDFEKYYKLSKELKKSSQIVKDDTVEITIAAIPDDKFYHA